MDETRWPRLEVLLTRNGLVRAADIARDLGVNQSTVSRLLADAGARVVRIGRARAARYALAREIGRAGSHWPLYRINGQGRSERLGELHALTGERFWFESSGSRSAFLHADFCHPQIAAPQDSPARLPNRCGRSLFADVSRTRPYVSRIGAQV